jgi:hypothetical protein
VGCGVWLAPSAKRLQLRFPQRCFGRLATGLQLEAAGHQPR